MSQFIEDTTPISVLADRVWNGTEYHYPNLEAMISEIKQLRAALDCFADKVVEVDTEIFESMGEACSGQGPKDDAMYKNPICTNAIDNAYNRKRGIKQ